MLDDLRPRDVMSCVAHEKFEQRKFLGRQFDGASAAFHAMLHAVEFQVLDAEHHFGRSPAPQERPEVGAKLGKGKRLPH